MCAMASNTATKRSITADSSSKRTAEEKAKAALDERDEKSIIKVLTIHPNYKY